MIREMRKSDLERVIEIERDSFSDPWTENMFQELFHNPVYKSFVIEENGKISAYMSVIATNYVFEIINIAVAEPFRKRGLASLLIKEAKKLAKSLSADKILLEVRALNHPAQNLYLKEGFTFDGIRKGYYGDEDALLMSFNCEEII